MFEKRCQSLLFYLSLRREIDFDLLDITTATICDHLLHTGKIRRVKRSQRTAYGDQEQEVLVLVRQRPAYHGTTAS